MKRRILALAVVMLLGCFQSVLAEERILSPEEIPLAESEAGMLEKLGLFFGTENGLELERNVTRAEAVVMAERFYAEEIHKLTNASEAGIGSIVSPYTDIPDNYWALPAIQNAGKKQIIAGTGDGKFEPDRTVTGKEFAVMVLKEMGYTDASTANAYDSGVECGLLVNNFTTSVVKEDRELSRSDTVRLCYDALFAQNAGGQTVKDVFIANRRFTEEEFNAVTTCSLPASKKRTFAEKLGSVMPAEQNYMFSPLSVKMALAMAANGAGEPVKAEILELLDIPDLDQYNQAAKALIEKYEKQTALEMNIANSIWLNEDQALLKKNAEFGPLFTRTIQDSYFGTVHRTSNEKAVEEVNTWTEQKTKGKIDKIISDADFTALLANAVYFKADWEKQFDPQFTRPAMFNNYDGTAMETDFMHDTQYVQYYNQNGIEMVRLPYKDSNTAMYIMLTQEEQPDFESIIKNAQMKTEKVILSIPKFESEFFIDLSNSVMDLGVKLAFGDSDPFPKIVIGEPMKISKILHKTYIKVEEQGTEAAAVTVIGMECTSAAAPEERIYFTADRPFTYVIQDDDSGEILFAGRYASAK